MRFSPRALMPSPALLIALLALFVALGGSSVAAPVRDAASKLITGKQVKNSSLTSSDIKNGSLLAADFKAGQMPVPARGPQGIQGIQGPQGERGPKGDAGNPGQDGADGAAGATNVTVRSVASTPAGMNTNTTHYAEAQCNPGEHATGGGWYLSNINSYAANVRVVESTPLPNLSPSPTGWRAVVYWADANDPDAFLVANAVCAAP